LETTTKRIVLLNSPSNNSPPNLDNGSIFFIGNATVLIRYAGFTVLTDPTFMLRLYITGDTLVFDDIKKIPKRYSDIDVALLHLGGTTVMGIMLTMDGKEGVEMFKIINPKKAIPIHYNDYDVFKSKLEDFQIQIREAGLEDRIHYLMHGETYNFEVSSNKNNNINGDSNNI
jgi:L-ascorbate metabolism protein UlaG (beta-lactamase superfamily)